MKRWYHKMVEPIHHLHLQMRLEGRVIVDECFIRAVEAVPGEDMPLMLIAGLANGRVVVYYDEAVPGDLQEALAASIAELEFPAIDPLLDIFKTHGVQPEVGHYKTYVFPSIPVKDKGVDCFSKVDKRVSAFGFGGLSEQVYVMEREGKVVSACVSTRENEKCGEAGCLQHLNIVIRDSRRGWSTPGPEV